jgi:hypothetical protein
MHTYEIDDYKIHVYESYTSLRCVSMRYICLQGRHGCKIQTYDAHVYKAHLSYWRACLHYERAYLLYGRLHGRVSQACISPRRASLPSVHLSPACISHGRASLQACISPRRAHIAGMDLSPARISHGRASVPGALLAQACVSLRGGSRPGVEVGRGGRGGGRG